MLGRGQPAVAVPGPLADVSVIASAGPQAVPPGGTFDLTMTLDNAGPFDATNVLLRVGVPAHTTFVSWYNASRSHDEVPVMTPPPGGTGTVSACIGTLGKPASPGDYRTLIFVLTVRVDAETPQGEMITGTATVSGVQTAGALWCPATTYDPNPDNNTATATTTVSGPADVTVSASGSPDPVTAGTNLTYALEVTNTGSLDAQQLTLTSLFSPSTRVSFVQESGPAFTLDTGDPRKVTASIASLPAGESGRFTLVVNVPATTLNGSVLDNSVWASSATGDPDWSNNRTTVRTQVIAGP